MTDAAKAWLEYIEMVDTFSRRYPDIPVLTIRYEEICSDLAGTMARILEFFEVSNAGEYTYDRSKTYHLLGNKMRKQFNGDVKESLTWQKELSIGDMKLITRIMKEALIRYGYI